MLDRPQDRACVTTRETVRVTARDRTQYWDFCTGFCLLFTAFVTPFEVGIGLKQSADALFFFNQVVNLVFTIDIVLQFFIPVPDNRPEKGGELIRSHRKIAAAYLKSWFAIDVVSILPLDVSVPTGPSALPSRGVVCSAPRGQPRIRLHVARRPQGRFPGVHAGRRRLRREHVSMHAHTRKPPIPPGMRPP